MSIKQDMEKLKKELAALNRRDVAHGVEEMMHLNAPAGSLEELGEGDLEDAAGGACGTFSCGLYRLANSPDET
jgi:hypothetical protein